MQWVVERRYSDFRIFHKLIRARLPQMGSLPFPPKSYFFSRWASTIARRQAAFEQYLDVLLSLEPVPPELKDFLEVPLPNGRGGFRLSAAQLSISSSSSNGGGGRYSYGGRFSANVGGHGYAASLSARMSSYEDAERGYMVNPDIGVPAHGRPVSVSDFTLVRVIGQGSFGKVFMVRPKWDCFGQPIGDKETQEDQRSKSYIKGDMQSLPSRVFAMKVVKKSDVKRRNRVRVCQ